jgi:DnaJ-class molecular chaperone
MRKVRGGSNITRIAVCKDCKGDGVIIIPGIHLGHGNYDDDTEETCETCEGTGMVKIKKQVFTTITIMPHKVKQLEV